MIRIFVLFLLLFSSPVFAGKSYKWSINGNPYCEGWSAQESFDCYVEDHKKMTDYKFKLSPPALIKDGAVQSYFILASKEGGEWSQEPLYDAVERKEVICPIETEKDGPRKGMIKLFPMDTRKEGMHLSPGLQYHYCKDSCLYEGTIIVSHDLPPLGEGMMYFEQTGIPCISQDNAGDDKAPPYSTPPEEQPRTDPNPPDKSPEWIMCPSHRGFYREGTEPTGDCLKSPEKPKEPKPEEPKKPDEPKPPEPPKPPEKPPEPEKPDDKNHGHRGGGGGGGGGNHGGKDDGKDTPTPQLPPGGGGGHGGGSGGGSGGGGGHGGGSGGGAGGGNNGGGNSGNDNDHGGPNGKDDGKGDNDKDDGKGGVSGGNCQAGKAPTCKGDPVQCYIAREQWRTACLAERNGSSVSGGGDCSKPPQCKGDEAQCYMVKKQHEIACAAQRNDDRMKEIDDYGNKHRKFFDALDTNGSEEGITDSIGKQQIDLPKQLDTGIVRLPDQCPVIPPINMGIFGTAEIPTDQFCDFARTFGRVVLAITYIVAFGIIVRAT